MGMIDSMMNKMMERMIKNMSSEEKEDMMMNMMPIMMAGMDIGKMIPGMQSGIAQVRLTTAVMLWNSPSPSSNCASPPATAHKHGASIWFEIIPAIEEIELPAIVRREIFPAICARSARPMALRI